MIHSLALRAGNLTEDSPEDSKQDDFSKLDGPILQRDL